MTATRRRVAGGTAVVLAASAAPSVLGALDPQLAALIEQGGKGALVALLVLLVYVLLGLRNDVGRVADGLSAVVRRADEHDQRLRRLERPPPRRRKR